MLLIIALVLFVVFGGLGFALHILWLGLILAAIVGVFHFLTGGRRSRT
jgi:hypothetical protein